MIAWKRRWWCAAGAAWLGLLLGIVCPAGAAPPVDAVTAFDEANKLYEQAKYGAAADAYEQLLKLGQQTPAVLFNLGNARLKNGEVGRGVIAFLQASALAPRDEGIRANLQFARRSVRGAGEGSIPLWQRVLTRLRANEWAGIASLGLIALFTLMAAGEWRRTLAPTLVVPRRVAIAVAAISLSGLMVTATVERRVVAVVVTREATIRFTPLDESPVAYTAADGTELTVVGQKGTGQEGAEWLEVQDATERTGWVRRNQVGFVNGPGIR
jgi:hypothetical protein